MSSRKGKQKTYSLVALIHCKYSRRPRIRQTCVILPILPLNSNMTWGKSSLFDSLVIYYLNKVSLQRVIGMLCRSYMLHGYSS